MRVVQPSVTSSAVALCSLPKQVAACAFGSDVGVERKVKPAPVKIYILGSSKLILNPYEDYG